MWLTYDFQPNLVVRQVQGGQHDVFFQCLCQRHHVVGLQPIVGQRQSTKHAGVEIRNGGWQREKETCGREWRFGRVGNWKIGKDGCQERMQHMGEIERVGIDNECGQRETGTY